MIPNWIQLQQQQQQEHTDKHTHTQMLHQHTDEQHTPPLRRLAKRKPKQHTPRHTRTEHFFYTLAHSQSNILDSMRRYMPYTDTLEPSTLHAKAMLCECEWVNEWMCMVRVVWRRMSHNKASHSCYTRIVDVSLSNEADTRLRSMYDTHKKTICTLP